VAQQRHEGGDADERDRRESEPGPSCGSRPQQPRVEQQRQWLRREDGDGDERVGGGMPVDGQQADTDGRQPGGHPQPADEGHPPATREQGDRTDGLQQPEEDEDHVHGRGRRGAPHRAGVAARAEGADRVVPQGVADPGQEGQAHLGDQVGRLGQPRGTRHLPARPLSPSHTVTLAPGSLGRLAGVTTQTERSLVLVKPDGFARGLSGEVLRRIEAKGYTLAALAVTTPTREQLAEHYAEHEGKPFYEPLVEFMSSGPVTAIVIEGNRCIEGFRALAGATDPTAALPGTIRGDLGRDWGKKVQENIVHGSDSPESAAREIAIWFPNL
jgi:nucleoside-diphosphate kinase